MAVRGATSGTAGGGTRAKRQPSVRTSNDSSDQVAVIASSEPGSSGAVGRRLRARRELLGISLRQFARELNVSASFISQLETGKAQPSVATLYAICTALKISIDDVFDMEPDFDAEGENVLGGDGARDTKGAARQQKRDEGSSRSRPRVDGERRSPVVAPSQRRLIVLDSGVTWERLSSSANAHFDFVFVRYDVGGSSNTDGRLIRHVGTECGYVLRGVLEVTLGFETFLMSAGDAISFDSSTPHRLANVGDEPVEAIWFDEGGHNRQS